MFRFVEREMTDGDEMELLRLTCKAAGLRATIHRRRIAGEYPRHLAAALDATKRDIRDITARYA